MRRHRLLESIRDHCPAILRTAGYALFQNAALYVILMFVPTFRSETLGYSSVVASTSSVASTCVICVGLGVILAVFLGRTLAAMNELFSTRVRYGGFSLGDTKSVLAFGGTAPFLLTLPIVLTAPETALARLARTRVGVLRA